MQPPATAREPAREGAVPLGQDPGTTEDRHGSLPAGAVPLDRRLRRTNSTTARRPGRTSVGQVSPGIRGSMTRAPAAPLHVFRDRQDAGRGLAGLLHRYRDRPDFVVLALPRGGVPVAYEVAQALHAPLDVFTVRKLGVPGHEELAMGAIASGGLMVLVDDVVRGLTIAPADVQAAAERE